ncbi:MAG: S-adenosylmethionine decarboxylase proenzyme [Rhodocyclales bacterium GWA2_65_20]|nr:MAG: S-adenosylmethionine decarboxylase proenzyme [Rhodocyclales bacterium GWA2_65_20]
MNGLHILAEFHDCACEPATMLEPQALRRLCLASCAAAGLSVVGEVFHGFGTPVAPAGATGAVVLAESHLAVHTWPELGAVTLDLYVCNFCQDNRAAAEAAYVALAAAFGPGRIVRRDVERGGPAVDDLSKVN